MLWKTVSIKALAKTAPDFCQTFPTSNHFFFKNKPQKTQTVTHCKHIWESYVIVEVCGQNLWRLLWSSIQQDWYSWCNNLQGWSHRHQSPSPQPSTDNSKSRVFSIFNRTSIHLVFLILFWVFYYITSRFIKDNQLKLNIHQQEIVIASISTKGKVAVLADSGDLSPNPGDGAVPKLPFSQIEMTQWHNTAVYVHKHLKDVTIPKI